jgi:O-antigen/teichoic acid export membrane protein
MNAGLGGVTGVLGHGIAIGVNLVSIPLTVTYLGPEQYGVWLTISSFVAWMTVADLGFSSALTNAISVSHGKDDPISARALTTTAFWFLLAVSTLIGLIGISLIPFLNWTAIFNVQSTSGIEKEIRSAVALTLLFFCVTCPSNLSRGVYAGYQELYKSHFWSIAANMVSLISLLVVVRLEGGLPALVMALMGAPTIVRCMNTIHLLIWEKPYLKPTMQFFSPEKFKRLWDLGKYYVVQQIGNIGMFHIQPIILAHLVSPMSVGQFTISYRLMTLSQQMLILLTLPLVGAYGEAHIRKDWGWIRKTLIGTTCGSLATMLVLTAVLASTSGAVITWWVGESMVVDSNTILWLGIYAMATGFSTPVVMFVQGFEEIRDIAAIAMINGIFTLIAGFALTAAYGTAGMAAAMAFGMIIINCGGLFLSGRRIMTRIPGHQTKEYGILGR